MRRLVSDVALAEWSLLVLVKITQQSVLGEEMAAQTGHNSEVFALALAVAATIQFARPRVRAGVRATERPRAAGSDAAAPSHSTSQAGNMRAGRGTAFTARMVPCHELVGSFAGKTADRITSSC